MEAIPILPPPPLCSPKISTAVGVQRLPAGRHRSVFLLTRAQHCVVCNAFERFSFSCRHCEAFDLSKIAVGGEVVSVWFLRSFQSIVPSL